jgi:hypothetical protein
VEIGSHGKVPCHRSLMWCSMYYGSTIALFVTKLNLVLLTSWVSFLNKLTSSVILTDTPTHVVDSPSGSAPG